MGEERKLYKVLVAKPGHNLGCLIPLGASIHIDGTAENTK
jgi:hypothetical protein